MKNSKINRIVGLSCLLSLSFMSVAACSNEQPNTSSAEVTKSQGVQKSDTAIKANVASLSYKGEGKEIYQDYCAACHQPEGEGIEGIYPALPGNEFVNGSSEDLIFLLLEGRAGMPAFYEDLAPEEVTNVLNHLRHSWGNSADMITQKQVDAALEELGEDGDGFSRSGD